MSDVTLSQYATNVWKAILGPDAWDAAGGSLTRTEETFAQWGELVAKLQKGELKVTDAAQVDRFAKFFSRVGANIAATVSGINVPAVNACFTVWRTHQPTIDRRCARNLYPSRTHARARRFSRCYS